MSSSEILAAHRGMGKVPVDQLFTRKELVGKGAYGGVYKGIHNATGLVVALKVIDLDTPDDDITEIQKEVALLSEMRDAARHNITLYHGCYLHKYELWIAMDFASGGSIRTLMKSGAIEEKYIVLIVREVLVALSFLHRQGIIHRDVKAANILLTQVGKILLADFGVAAHLQTNNKRSTFIGTPLWMAPEVITDGKLYDTKADIWSLGVTLYEIATGNPPYFGMEPLRACALIPRSQPARLEGGSWSNAMRDFLAVCLQIDPLTRPTADELSRNKWIKIGSKQPMSILRELISRYVGWIQMGGQRASIAGLDSPLKREDTFDIDEEDMWDFDVEEDDSLGFEPLGDEPPRSLDAQAVANSQRPPKPVRNHALLRLFDEESNPYAQPSHVTSIQLPSGPASHDTVRPTISIPSFDDLDDMYESKPTQFGGFGRASDDLMTPATVRANAFPWSSQPAQSFGSSGFSAQSSTDDSEWGVTSLATPTEATFAERAAAYGPVSTSPSLPSMASNRPFMQQSRRRADTAPSSEYPPLGPGIPAPMPPRANGGTHSATTSISSAAGSLYMSGSGSGSTSASTSYTNLTSSPPSFVQQRSFTGLPSTQPPLAPTFNRSRTVAGDADVNRPFRARQGSDAAASRPFRLGLGQPPIAGAATVEMRSRTGSDSSAGSRPMGLHEKRGLKLHINTSSSGSGSSLASSITPASAHSRSHSRTGSGVLSYNFAPPITSAFSSSYASALSANGAIRENEGRHNDERDEDDDDDEEGARPLHWTDPAFIAKFGGGSGRTTPLAREAGGGGDFPFPSAFVDGGPGGAVMASAGGDVEAGEEYDEDEDVEDEDEEEEDPWAGPPLRALDYAKLMTTADVEMELETTLGELGRWLEMVDGGLERILGGTGQAPAFVEAT